MPVSADQTMLEGGGDIGTIVHSPSRFRFTLRALLILMAAVGAALALYLHYGPLPGLFFAAFVLLGGLCYLGGRKKGLVVFVVLYAVLWVGLQFFGPYTSLRNRIVWIVGTERLREWAVEMFDSQPPVKLGGHTIISLDRHTMPEDIRAIAGNEDNFMIMSYDGEDDCIMFGYEDIFHQWS